MKSATTSNTASTISLVAVFIMLTIFCAAVLTFPEFARYPNPSASKFKGAGDAFPGPVKSTIGTPRKLIIELVLSK